MIDLKAARQEPDRYRTALARRGAAKDFDALLAADARWREHTERAETLRAAQKRSSKGKPGPDELAELRQLAAEFAAATEEQAHAARERDELLARIPNLPDPTAADGMDEDDAELVRTWGEQPKFGFEPKDALDLGSSRGWIDMASGARLSGSRFAYRIGDVALAEMALYRFVIDNLADKGFLLVLPPVLAGEQAMYGTGFLPTEESNLYHLEKDDLYLTGTSEVALAGIHAEERLEEEQLPALYAGFTTNFRREAGAAGKDTKGMFRVHQFDKVEMYVYCRPEQSGRVPRAAARLRGGDRPGARPALPGDEHRGRRPRRPRREEVRHRGLVPDPGAVPGDHLLLEHHRLPGAAAEHPVPPRRQPGVRAHAQRHRRDRPRAALDHGELPGRGRHGGRPRGAAALRRPGHARRAALERWRRRLAGCGGQLGQQRGAVR